MVGEEHTHDRTSRTLYDWYGIVSGLLQAAGLALFVAFWHIGGINAFPDLTTTQAVVATLAAAAFMGGLRFAELDMRYNT